jgi:hypothetical protein
MPDPMVKTASKNMQPFSRYSLLKIATVTHFHYFIPLISIASRFSEGGVYRHSTIPTILTIHYITGLKQVAII